MILGLQRMASRSQPVAANLSFALGIESGSGQVPALLGEHHDTLRRRTVFSCYRDGVCRNYFAANLMCLGSQRGVCRDSGRLRHDRRRCQKSRESGGQSHNQSLLRQSAHAHLSRHPLSTPVQRSCSALKLGNTALSVARTSIVSACTQPSEPGVEEQSAGRPEKEVFKLPDGKRHKLQRRSLRRKKGFRPEGAMKRRSQALNVSRSRGMQTGSRRVGPPR